MMPHLPQNQITHFQKNSSKLNAQTPPWSIPGILAQSPPQTGPHKRFTSRIIWRNLTTIFTKTTLKPLEAQLQLRCSHLCTNYGTYKTKYANIKAKPQDKLKILPSLCTKKMCTIGFSN